MFGIIDFINQYRYFSIILVLLNFFIVKKSFIKLYVYFHRYLLETKGNRKPSTLKYKEYVKKFKNYIDYYDKKRKSGSYYDNLKSKLKKAGYRGQYAPLYYLILKFIVPLLLCILYFVVNYPNVKFRYALLLMVLCSILVDLNISKKRKRINLAFQKNVYKIYKYLSNQVSAGVRVIDAIKTLYLVVEDSYLQQLLVILSARYSRTLNIDESLGDFKENFDIQEVDSLCVALKQGIETGDNRDLLVRQEDIMFKKYFNYIQAETDHCRTKATIAIFMFMLIIVVMISVPLFRDAKDALDKIFI